MFESLSPIEIALIKKIGGNTNPDSPAVEIVPWSTGTDEQIAAMVAALDAGTLSVEEVCVNAAGITVSKDIYTGNEKQALVNTGKFKALTDKKYLSSGEYLKRGDILLGSGHTAVVLSNGSKVAGSTPAPAEPQKPQTVKIDTAKSFDKSIAGTYTVTANVLNIRAGAGKNKTDIGDLKKGTKAVCYGYYTKADGVKWFLVVANGITGYVSSEYLKK